MSLLLTEISSLPLSGVQTAINDIKKLIQQAVNASNEKANTNISNANKQQTEQTSKPKVPTALTAKPSSSNSGGDGVPRVGDAVTFVNINLYNKIYITSVVI